LPHLLKSVFNQVRPDRRTVRGHLHGIPLSGNARDAFPSGHAIHIGALASAATELPPYQRNIAWGWVPVLSSPGSSCLRIGRATSLPALL
jgi:hypothetical protein